MGHRTQWLTPSPLWGELAEKTDKGPFRSPAVLRFSTDQFMEDLQGVLANDPSSLRDYIVQAESWRRPAVGLDGSMTTDPGKDASSGDAGEELPSYKLFQPVHGRFYLVSASLVCRRPGLPDHKVRTSQGERTTFVLRRLRPKSGAAAVDCSVFDPQHCDEYAWIVGDKSGWTRAGGSGLAEGEERLPMSAFQFSADGISRRMLAGLIPASRRQTYVAGREITLQGNGNGQSAAVQQDDVRKIEFQRQVLDPWVELINFAKSTNLPGPPLSQPPDPVSFGLAQGSALVLIDFSNFLHSYLRDVWDAIQDPTKAAGLRENQAKLYAALSATVGDLVDNSRWTLVDAIKSAKAKEADFESSVLIAGSQPSLPQGYSGPMLSDTSDPKLAALIQRGSDPLQPRSIQTLAEKALDEVEEAPASDVRIPAKNPENPQGDDWYIVRCVYEQPQCGLKPQATLSEPCRPFQLASYFDPDAPARSIQVALPVDTTPAALRKYDKNVGFMISDQLGKQLSRVKGLKQLMDGDLADPNGFGLGMICSFSIPIITICAFIVLMIFLILLNIIFWWLPFFRICFPLPTLKAKGS